MKKGSYKYMYTESQIDEAEGKTKYFMNQDSPHTFYCLIFNFFIVDRMWY